MKLRALPCRWDSEWPIYPEVQWRHPPSATSYNMPMLSTINPITMKGSDDTLNHVLHTLALLADALHNGDGDIDESQNDQGYPVACWRFPFPLNSNLSPNFCHHWIEMWNGIRDNGAFLGRQLLAVLLLTMLNLIDAITYGQLIIPNPTYSSLGMTMFLLSTFILN